MNGTGYTAAQTLATMSIPQADANVMHLFILAYDGTTCEVFHASGAGDTVIAASTLALCVKDDPVQAAEIANYAAGVVVGKLGTATVTANELKNALK